MLMNEKFEVHPTLNPKLWGSNNLLLTDVRNAILAIVEQFSSVRREIEQKADLQQHIIG